MNSVEFTQIYFTLSSNLLFSQIYTTTPIFKERFKHKKCSLDVSAGVYGIQIIQLSG